MGDKVFLLLFFLFLTINGQSTTSNPTSEKEYSTKEENSKSTSPDLTGAESSVQYSTVDAPKGKEDKSEPNNNVTYSEEERAGLDFIKSILDDSSSSESGSDENEDDSLLSMNPGEDPLLAANTDEVGVRHEAPEYEGEEKMPGLEPEGPPETEERMDSPPQRFEPQNDQAFRDEPSGDGSPVLQLTQGGYRRLYSPTDRFNDQRQRLRSESATEQADRVETPEGSSGERSRIPFQNPFAPFLQAPFTLASTPVFQHPFQQQQHANRAIQNSFYNTQPEFNQQYSHLENAGDFPNVHFTIQTAPRVPMQHHPFLFQNPFQVPSSQPLPINPGRQMPSLFQAGGSPYSNFDSSADSVGADFAALFGNPMSQSIPAQGSPYGVNSNLGGNAFANQPLNLMSTFPNTNERSQFSPRLLSQPLPNGQMAPQGRNGDISPDALPKEIAENEDEQRNESPAGEDSEPTPFGTRIQKSGEEENQENVERQDNMYIKYPTKEAGYATEEVLPAENETKSSKDGEERNVKQRVSFFAVPPRFNIFNGPDPYKIALENVQRDYPRGSIRNNEDKNDTKESQSEEFIRNLALGPNQPNPQQPPQIFRPYPERNQQLSIPGTPFFPLQNSDRNPFEPVAIFPDSHYQYIARPPGPIRAPGASETEFTPACARNTNSSLCFEDPEYPRGEIIYALNSDSYMMDRLVMPNQQLEGIPLVEMNKTENPETEENYICKSDIKYGLPLRAKNIDGDWKVIVNMKRAMGRGRFVQPVRLEVCKGLGEPCSSSQPKTTCVQKFTLQRLLSWNLEKGVHNDVYRLPVACSCQILEEKKE